jgi:hypothetical protein
MIGGQLACPKTPRADLRLARDSPGRGVQPAAEGRALVETGSLSRQGQKRRLHGIFAIGLRDKKSAAHRPDRRCMPVHKLGEGLGVSPLREAAEQLEIGFRLRAKLSALRDELT